MSINEREEEGKSLKIFTVADLKLFVLFNISNISFSKESYVGD